jgi:hypothetical protein
MRRRLLLRGALAFLMGALVGGYRLAIPLPLPLWLPIAISILAVSAPVALVALRSDPILRNRGALIAILALPALLMGVLLIRIVLPQLFVVLFGLSELLVANLAFGIALLLAPAAAAFSLSASSSQPEPGDHLRRRATAYGVLAWVGIGVHNILPYLNSASWMIWYAAMGQGISAQAAGLERIVLGIALFAVIAWIMGFALAAVEGAGVAALLNRVEARIA